MAFFFSAISTSVRNSVSVKEDEIDEESSDSGSEIPSTASQNVVGNRTLVHQKFYPAITYWIALTTPNGAPANPITVHRALLTCGVQVVANQVITTMVFRCFIVDV